MNSLTKRGSASNPNFNLMISQSNPDVKYDFSLTPKESQRTEEEALDFEDDSDDDNTAAPSRGYMVDCSPAQLLRAEDMTEDPVERARRYNILNSESLNPQNTLEKNVVESAVDVGMNNTAFNVYDEAYKSDLLCAGNVKYTKNNKSINELLSQRREVPKARAYDAFVSIVSQPDPTVNRSQRAHSYSL